MKTYWPDYYKDFRCKADRCLHTCCASWTICIDDDSLARFNKEPEISSKIEDGSFILKEGDRCPFLRDDNLCEMIIKHGEDYICDICREHPRYYNTFPDHIEAGIGLVCEEACRLALERRSAFELISDDGTVMTLPSYLQLIFDGKGSLTNRLAEISGGRRSGSKLRAEIFAQMEVMDPLWNELLGKIIASPVSGEDEDKVISENEQCLTNFAAYLLYRYKGAGRFASESVYLLADLIFNGCDVFESARLFSGEVEYSDINIDDALETFV
ncbi:MAG: flagellin lysine-N-methylase [Clostridiales bacterium]|nr:flagellin lysine-N-methylase [Clostridiales bacterium]